LGLWACKAGALQLEPCLQSILLWLFLEMRSPELFVQASLNLDPPNWSQPPKVARIIGTRHWCLVSKTLIGLTTSREDELFNHEVLSDKGFRAIFWRKKREVPVTSSCFLLVKNCSVFPVCMSVGTKWTPPGTWGQEVRFTVGGPRWRHGAWSGFVFMKLTIGSMVQWLEWEMRLIRFEMVSKCQVLCHKLGNNKRTI
jgi:hypothetical protein